MYPYYVTVKLKNTNIFNLIQVCGLPYLCKGATGMAKHILTHWANHFKRFNLNTINESGLIDCLQWFGKSCKELNPGRTSMGRKHSKV